jgi:hypothetical protein
MAYKLNSPWEWQTWGAGNPWPDKYSRIAGRPITGGTYTGTINPFITDVARGVTLIVNGSTVTATLYPYQDDLSNADHYYLGGHEYTISDAEAAILTAAGYGSYLTPVV